MQDIKSDAKWDFVATKYPQLLSTAVKAGTSILEPVYEPITLGIACTSHGHRVSLVSADLEPFATLSAEGKDINDALSAMEREFVRAIVELTSETWPLAPAVFESLRFKFEMQHIRCLYEKPSDTVMLIPFTAIGG